MARGELLRLRVLVDADYTDGVSERVHEQVFPPTCHMCGEKLQTRHGFISATLVDVENGLAFVCHHHLK